MSATISTAKSAATTASTELRRDTLGVGAIVFFVISAASPLAVLAGGFPIGMLMGDGVGTPTLVLFTLAVLLLFSVGYTTMARHITNAGGFFAFSCCGLNGFAGGAAGMLALCAYNILQISLYGMFGAVVSGNMASVFGIFLPWWFYAFLAMIAIGALGYRQVDLSAKVLAVSVLGEYISILVLDFLILKSGGAHGINMASFRAQNVFSGSPSIGLLFCFSAFIGFEAATIYGEEAKNPKRTVPLATYIAVLLVGIFYSFSLWSLIIGVGSDNLMGVLRGLSDPTTFIYGVSRHYSGPLTDAIRVLFMFGVFAGMTAFHNAAARYFYATGRDGLLPGMLGNTHRDHQSPHIASLLQTAIAAVVVVICAVTHADPILQLFAWFSSLAALCIILLMALTSAAVIGFSLRHPEHKIGVWKGLLFPAISGLALLAIVVLAIIHFDVLTGASKTLSYALTSVVPIVAVTGVWLAYRLRKVSPERYETIGMHKL